MRVLIAEDDTVSRRIIEARLVDWKYEVVAVSNGIQALETLRSDNAPRLALLDWMMPLKDGPQVCRELRSHALHRYTYVILVTTRSDAADIAAGLESGADDYVIKPVEHVELRARLLAGSRIIDLQDQLLETQEELRHQATHDSLTGLWNRDAILDKLEIELQRSRRHKTCLTVIMCDVDRFKAINDTHGHLAGDAVMRGIGQSLAGAIRIYDAAGRYGGDEFLIVAPGCDKVTANALVDRLQTQMRRQIGGFSEPINVTGSFGLVTVLEGSMDEESVIRAADKALYRAKAMGRDRVEAD